jgi:hypothetical protein
VATRLVPQHSCEEEVIGLLQRLRDPDDPDVGGGGALDARCSVGTACGRASLRAAVTDDERADQRAMIAASFASVLHSPR